LINVPIVFVSLKGYNIVILFLIGNLVCTICAIPLLVGLITRFEGFVTGWSMVTGIITGFLSIVVFGYIKMGDMSAGLHYTFVESYDWPSFVLPLVFSFLGVMLAAIVEKYLRIACGFKYPVPLTLPPEAVGPDHGEESSIHDVESYGPDKRATEMK
jgi:predicted small lipoprotein YifL